MDVLGIFLQKTKFLHTYSSLRMFEMPNSQNQATANIAIEFQDKTITQNREPLAEALNQLNVKSTPHSKILKRRLDKINIEVPRLLSESLGYQGSDRWVQIFWAPEPIDRPICSDGKVVYSGSKLAWELFLENIIQSFEVLDTSLRDNSFLLDRWQHILYFGTKETISELINNRECLELLSPSKRKNDMTQIRDFGATFVLGAICGATVAGVLFSIGLGLFETLH